MTQAEDIRPTYYGIDSKPMEHAEWLDAYPERVSVAYAQVVGALVRTEFVGIDHNPNRGTPWIFETTATVNVGESYIHIHTFAWSGGRKRSRCWHWLACAFACVGGALWWRYQAYKEGT